MQVLGLDGFKKRWVGVALRDGAFERAEVYATVRIALAAHPDALVVGIDMPIGLPEEYGRLADKAARHFIGAKRASSVFLTHPRRVLAEPNYPAACAAARELYGVAITRQAYGLRLKIIEVEEAASIDARTIEVHPEVSFRALAGACLKHSKGSWNGLAERRMLLKRAGVVLPDTFTTSAGDAGADDVVDAAVAAWSAHRVAHGMGEVLPGAVPVPIDLGTRGIIWY